MEPTRSSGCGHNLVGNFASTFRGTDETSSFRDRIDRQLCTHPVPLPINIQQPSLLPPELLSSKRSIRYSPGRNSCLFARSPTLRRSAGAGPTTSWPAPASSCVWVWSIPTRAAADSAPFAPAPTEGFGIAPVYFVAWSVSFCDVGVVASAVGSRSTTRVSA